MTRKTLDEFFTPLRGAATTPFFTRTGRATSMTIYSGAQPSAQTIEANWINYNQDSTGCLAHYSTGPTWSYNEGTKTYYFTNTSDTITTTALRSGTATWAIIWMATGVSITSTTTSPANEKFIVVPVTNNSGIGVVRYTNTTTTMGESFIPYDGGLTIVEA
jgi:hypothetical protein